MKKICFLSGDMSRSGGTERVLAIIANELCKKEDLFEIHILSTVNEKNISFFKIDSRIKKNRILKFYLFKTTTEDISFLKILSVVNNLSIILFFNNEFSIILFSQCDTKT